MGVAKKYAFLILLNVMLFCPLTAMSADMYAPKAENTQSMDEVTAVLENYMKLEKIFDPSYLDSYSDDARIHITRIYAGDVKRKMKLEMADYRQVATEMLAIAKKWQDVHTYSNFQMQDDGDTVTVTAHRYSHRKNFSTPVKWLFFKGGDEQWKIFEEHFTTRY